MAKLTIVLLPGLGGTGDLFKPFIAALGTEFSAFVVSYPASEPNGYKELETLVRQSLPASTPFAILGESFSGPIAISITADPPPNLVATILCCTFTSNPQPYLSLLRWLLPFVSPRLAPLPAMSALLMGRHSTPALRSGLARAMAGLTAPAFRARLRAVLEVNVTGELANAQRPVLYLQALQDKVVSSAASARLTQANPQVRVARIDGPHFLLQVRPTEASASIGAFLAAQQNAI